MNKQEALPIRPQGYYIWPIFVFAVLATTVMLNIALFTLAKNTADTPIEDRAYERSQSYQTVIDQGQRAKEIGLDLEIVTNDREKVLILRQAQTQAYAAGQIILRATRPANSSMDFEKTLEELPSRPGHYALPQTTAPGLWLIEIRLTLPSGKALIRKQVVL
ncbi:FixH family protein [bacterium]|nr:FixH family protein [bacterium]